MVVEGLGTNLGCFGGILGHPENLTELLQGAERFREASGLEAPLVSEGQPILGSCWRRGPFPGESTTFAWEALLLGTDSTGTRTIPYLNQETMGSGPRWWSFAASPPSPGGSWGWTPSGRSRPSGIGAAAEGPSWRWANRTCDWRG